jgi:hypothetical protein
MAETPPGDPLFRRVRDGHRQQSPSLEAAEDRRCSA